LRKKVKNFNIKEKIGGGGEVNELTAAAYSTSIWARVELYMVVDGFCLIASSI